ncbi:hypothetical protein [Serratia sp. (in: enterobacteria)]|uniref:hypothetical protein n=1 Tax=Serratia sp. (in: enterobacteria) TaxID=616 RepID=UPI00398A3485
MSANNTVSIQLVLQGSPEVVNQIKSVLMGFNQLKVGLDGAKQSMSGGFRLDGLQGLQAAIGTTEQQTNKFRSTLSKIGGEISKNGSAFSVAAASVWGVYNAYDSLTKVQIRASQSITRVSSLTTTLATLENRLAEARDKGNLSAEEMAILEQRITDTKSKLAVAQERSADLQGDVNEAWGQFASQVGPQAIAATGSMAQVVTTMRGSLTGIIPRIKEFFGGMSSIAGSSAAAATSVTPLGGIFQATGNGAQIGATGIRAMSGAIKGLLIGTGIGAVLVAIGLLTEGFGLLTEATGETSKQLTDEFGKMGEGPKTYQTMVSDHLSKANEIVQAHAEVVKKSSQEQTSAYVKSVEEQLVADRAVQEMMTNKTKLHLDTAKTRLQQLKTEEEGMIKFGVVWQEQNRKIEAQQNSVNALDSSYKTYNSTLGQIDSTLVTVGQRYTYLKEQEQAIAQNQDLLRNNLGNVVVQWDNTVESMKKAVDATIKQEAATIRATGSYEDAIGPLEAWAKSTFGQAGNLDLQAAAVSYVRDKVKELLPDQEKLTKAQEKSDKTMDTIIDKMADLAVRYGVDVPVAIATSVEAVDDYGKALERNQKALDEWKDKLSFLNDISGAEKAFKLEFDIDKEARDFVKDLPKDTRKKLKLIIDTQSDWQGVKSIFEIIAPSIFKGVVQRNERGEVISATVEIHPELDNEDSIGDIADTMIETIRDHFGKAANKEPISSIIEQLEGADTAAELQAAFQKWNIYLEDIVFEDPSAVASAWAGKATSAVTTKFSNLGPLGDAILNPKGKGGTTVNQGGKLVNVPNEPGGNGETAAQIADQTALQAALQKTQTALANLSNEGTKSLAALAKASSAAMNGISGNLKVGEVAAQKIQTGLANLSNEGVKSLAALAKASSAAMNGTRNNLSVGEVAAQKLQKGLANLAIQGSNSLRMLAQASSTHMNGFRNNLKVGETAARRLQSAIDDLKSKSITVTTTYVTKKVNAQHGFHGVVASPTNFTVGEGFKPELVSVTPLSPGASLPQSTGVEIQSGSVNQVITRNKGRGVSGSSGPTFLRIEMPVYLYPGGDMLRKEIREIPLEDTGRFMTA